MRKSLLVLACLASADHPGQVKDSSKRWHSSLHAADKKLLKGVDNPFRLHSLFARRSDGRVILEGVHNPVRVFAMFLLLFNAALAFNPSSPGGRHSLGKAISSSNRVGQHAVMSEADDFSPSRKTRSPVVEDQQAQQEDTTDPEVLNGMIQALGSRGMLIMADTLEKRGDLKGSEVLWRDVLEKQSRELGAEHHETLSSKLRIAELCREQGNEEEELKLLKEVLLTRLQCLGPEHPETLESKIFWADFLARRDRLRDVQEIQYDVMNTWLSWHGPDHECSLKIKRKLAKTLRARGKLGKAEDLQADVWEATNRTLGPDHELTLEDKLKYACILNVRGLDRKGWICLYNPDDPEMLTHILKLTSALREYGNFKDAEELKRAVMELKLQRILGGMFITSLKRNREKLEGLALKARKANLAMAAKARDKLKQAEMLMREVWTSLMREEGPFHPRTLESQNQLEWAQVHLNDMAALDNRIFGLGPRHPRTFDVIEQVALALMHFGRVQDAKELLQDVYDSRLQAYGDDDRRTVMSKESLALAVAASGNATLALQMQTEVLQFQMAKVGLYDRTTHYAMYKAADMVKAIGDLKGAEKLQREALIWEKRALGINNPKWFGRRLSLASTLLQQGDLIGAEDMLRISCEDCERILGPHHPTTVKSMRLLARVLEALGDAEGAKEWTRELPKMYWYDLDVKDIFSYKDLRALRNMVGPDS